MTILSSGLDQTGAQKQKCYHVVKIIKIKDFVCTELYSELGFAFNSLNFSEKILYSYSLI